MIKNSSECTKSELDLFYIPPTNTSIEDGGWTEYYPTTTVDSGPIEFNITPLQYEYIHLSKTTLHISVTIKKDNALVTTTDTIGPVNNFMHSLFSQIDLSLNGTSIESSNNTYAYKAYMTDLCNYGEDSKNTHMQAALFFKDQANNFESVAANDTTTPKIVANKGYEDRKKLLKNGSVEMIGRLHCDIFNSDRYLINNVGIKLTLNRSKNAFCLFGTGGFQVQIDSASLFIRKATISPSVMLAHAMVLEKSTAKYPIKRVVVKPLTISASTSSIIIDNVNNGPLPTRVLIGMVESEAYNGTFSKNPYNFQHFNVTKLGLSVGKEVPYNKPLNLDFSKDKYIRGYYSLFEGIDKPIFASGNDITRTDYANGYTLFAFDLTPDQCSGDQFNLLKSANMSLELEFSKALSKAVTVLVYMEYDNMIEINKNKQIFFDYKE